MTMQVADLRRINLRQNIKIDRDAWDVLRDRVEIPGWLMMVSIVVASVAVCVLMAACATPAHAQVLRPTIDMHRIMMIESSGNPLAHRKSDDSIGLYQITPVCLKEWNNFHPQNQYTRADLFNPAINTKIADWYLNVRIPQMLRHFRKPDTVENRLIAYNAGISYVINQKPLPKITIAYLKKYGVSQ